MLGPLPELRRAAEVNILNASALVVLAMVILIGIQTTYKTVYESDDVGFLLSQPVPEWAVFGAKFLTSYAVLVAMTLCYGLPVWLAFGYSRGLGAGFYLVTAIGFALLLLAAHALVTLLLITAMRFLPGRKMKQLFVALSAILGILFVLASQMLSARMSRSGDPMAMIEQLGKGQLSRMWYLPTSWMADGILGTLPEFGINGTSGWLALTGTALGGPYLALVLSGRWYLHGWSGRSEELGAGKVRKKPRTVRERTVPRRRMQGPFWSILRKDMKTLWRDPVVWYTLVVGAIGLGFFVYNMSSSFASAPDLEGPSEAGIVATMMVVMPALMGSISSSQTGGVSISREGKAFWMVRCAPVNPRKLMLAKFAYALLPQAIFVGAFDTYLEFSKVPHFPLPLNLTLGIFFILSLGSLLLLMDVYFPDFTLKVEMGASAGGKGTGKILLATFGSLGMVALLGVALSLPLILERPLGSLGLSMSVLRVSSYALIGLIATGLTAFLFGPGVKRLSRLLSDM
jgi:ABC-2 type transport system permease protein